jgi:hypothetical protein
MTEIFTIRQKIGLNIFLNINKTNDFFPQWYRKLLIYSHWVKRKLRYKCTYGKTKIYNRRPYGPSSIAPLKKTVSVYCTCSAFLIKNVRKCLKTPSPVPTMTVVFRGVPTLYTQSTEASLPSRPRGARTAHAHLWTAPFLYTYVCMHRSWPGSNPSPLPASNAYRVVAVFRSHFLRLLQVAS